MTLDQIKDLSTIIAILSRTIIDLQLKNKNVTHSKILPISKLSRRKYSREDALEVLEHRLTILQLYFTFHSKLRLDILNTMNIVEFFS